MSIHYTLGKAGFFLKRRLLLSMLNFLFWLRIIVLEIYHSKLKYYIMSVLLFTCIIVILGGEACIPHFLKQTKKKTKKSYKE